MTTNLPQPERINVFKVPKLGYRFFLPLAFREPDFISIPEPRDAREPYNQKAIFSLRDVVLFGLAALLIGVFGTVAAFMWLKGVWFDLFAIGAIGLAAEVAYLIYKSR